MAPILPAPASYGSSIGHTLARELESIKPTRTLPDTITRVLAARQQTTTVVSQGSGSPSNNLSGGAIAGIVIGSVAGFLILLWIIRSCINIRHPGWWGETFEPDNEKPPHMHYYGGFRPRYPRETHGYRSRSRHHHHHSHSPRVYVERNISPRAPPVVYHSDVRRSIDGRRHSRGY
ncbi:hypothetical protein F4804DRAFT_74517 [Jackrogersella minutella]|nr:hypothetical protein F4804DRAFT_74517 [Jackrogersella minutella]